MDLNFADQYKDYPTVELLKILKRPGDYQPEAIDAARLILESREVVAGDEREAEDALLRLGQQRKEQVDTYKEKVADFLQPVLQPGNEVEPAKWLNILLFFIALDFIYTLYQDVIRLINFVAVVAACHRYGVGLRSGGRSYGFGDCIGHEMDAGSLLALLGLAYFPWVFYLLLKRRRWGWILLFASSLFSFISALGQCYIFFEFRRMYHGSLPALLSTVLISAAFVYFLWRDDIVTFFGVTAKTKKETLAISISGSLLLIVAVFSL